MTDTHQDRLRELHHFETETAMIAALTVLESNEIGDNVERIALAAGILRNALESS